MPGPSDLLPHRPSQGAKRECRRVSGEARPGLSLGREGQHQSAGQRDAGHRSSSEQAQGVLGKHCCWVSGPREHLWNRCDRTRCRERHRAGRQAPGKRVCAVCTHVLSCVSVCMRTLEYVAVCAEVGVCAHAHECVCRSREPGGEAGEPRAALGQSFQPSGLRRQPLLRQAAGLGL